MRKTTKNRMTKALCNLFAIMWTILCLFIPSVLATENGMGSITINYVDKGIRIENGEYIQKDISLEGAEFSISLVAIKTNEGLEWVDEIENNDDFEYDTKAMFDKNTFENVAKELVKIAEKHLKKCTMVTDENGQCIFNDLEKGVYLIWESDKHGIADKYHNAVPFFIEIPNRSVDPYELDVMACPKAEIITEKMISVIGTKTWKGNDIVGNEIGASNDPNEMRVRRPNSITLRLYANGSEVAHTTVSADQNWSFAFDEVNALDKNGDNVVFTIKEDPVRGYVFSQDKAIVGENTIVINVTNTVDESSVQTGDETDPKKLVILIVSSFIALVFVLFWPAEKKKIN